MESIGPFRLSFALIAASVMLASCGGGDDNTAAAPPSVPPVIVGVACSFDTTVTLAYEEQRLTTPLPNTGNNVVGADVTPIADRIVKDTGFDTFATDFSATLCGANGKTPITSYDAAVDVVKTKGAALWRGAVDRVQGRRPSPAGSKLPNSDDRMLYWARVQMTKLLRQWKPDFVMTPAQLTDLQLQLERSSRGQYDINLPAGEASLGHKYRRMIMSGFDTFTLGTPGTPNTGLRNGNPSGAVALEMDGREFTLSDGTVLHVETYILPVNYDPFNLGMQEDTIGPWFRPGPSRVDASISMSQGSANIFNLEQFNGRFHGPSAGNDGIVYCPSGSRLPAFVQPIGAISAPGTAPIALPGSGCDVYPPQRWLGYDSVGLWIKDFPAQFTTTTLPIPAMVTGKTGAGVARPPGATSAGTEGFDVTWHTNYVYFANCTDPATVSVASNGVVNTMPDLSTVAAPSAAWCSRQGGGGDYLSNESAYRNTLLRDTFGLDIAAGHIHVPVMTNFFGGTVNSGGGVRDDNAITDARFEAYRTAIVTQAKALLLVIGNSLMYR
jgi:hypothetical protein